MINALRRWAKALKRDIIALWLGARDRRTPVLAKIVAGCVAAYALSPIDLIPDFIPVLGYLDDLLLVPLGIWVAIRLIPPALMAELRESASAQARPASPTAAVIVVGLWLLAAVLVGVLIRRSGGMAQMVALFRS
ncbi:MULTISPECIES: YkvA family protein [unclassified Brevundimonas]|uniref:YkvA family protein n=1 Tax=unclassified Brevundimonas TaxID=2622653 RepID=UPI0006FA4BE0|nr:hypothetical protein ASD25_14095 [Brevundimonas sp. Root1423]KRA28896.1 hypothetical protein ASD59_03535 [Brevundimonas sp. Root608]